ncbi:MAG: ABC transporter ATP-binding protein, partial [Planctomycetia bacterium]|nr:ABC transporter ATP-binding protein [Planctomycetia bacterium]
GEERRKKVEQVLDYVDLGYKRDALVTSLSRGMTQRLGLARVLLHDPQVLLLDEPASGLDPRARIEMRELIKRLRQASKTIMLSSHILPELAEICNKLGIIERGKLLFNGNVEEGKNEVRKARGGYVFLVSVGERNEEAAKRLSALPEISRATIDPKRPVIRVALRDGRSDGSFIPERLIADRFKLERFEEEDITVEDIFMTITKGITS